MLRNFYSFQGVVRIHILKAEKLEEKDSKVLGFGGGSDPYVIAKGTNNFVWLTFQLFVFLFDIFFIKRSSYETRP